MMGNDIVVLYHRVPLVALSCNQLVYILCDFFSNGIIISAKLFSHFVKIKQTGKPVNYN